MTCPVEMSASSTLLRCPHVSFSSIAFLICDINDEYFSPSLLIGASACSRISSSSSTCCSNSRISLLVHSPQGFSQVLFPCSPSRGTQTFIAWLWLIPTEKLSCTPFPPYPMPISEQEVFLLICNTSSSKSTSCPCFSQCVCS